VPTLAGMAVVVGTRSLSSGAHSRDPLACSTLRVFLSILASTANTSPHSRGGGLRPTLHESSVPQKREEQGMRVHAAPAVSCAKLPQRNAHTSIQVQREADPAFHLRNWFDGLWRALTGRSRICFVAVAPRIMAEPPGWAGFASTGLDANHEGVRTTRFCRTQRPVFAKWLRRARRRSSWRAWIIAQRDLALRLPARRRCRVPPHPLSRS